MKIAIDPIWTAKGVATKILASIFPSRHQMDADKSSGWPKVALEGKEGVVTTDAIHLSYGQKGHWEVNVDPMPCLHHWIHNGSQTW
jgi:hypothetical protein